MSDKTPQDRLNDEALAVFDLRDLNTPTGKLSAYARHLEEKIEQQQAALQVAEEALEEIKEFDTCECPAFSQDGHHHRIGCTWLKVQAALTAIQNLKTPDKNQS